MEVDVVQERNDAKNKRRIKFIRKNNDRRNKGFDDDDFQNDNANQDMEALKRKVGW